MSRRQPLLGSGSGQGAELGSVKSRGRPKAPMFAKYEEACKNQLSGAKERVSGIKYSNNPGAARAAARRAVATETLAAQRMGGRRAEGGGVKRDARITG